MDTSTSNITLKLVHKPNIKCKLRCLYQLIDLERFNLFIIHLSITFMGTNGKFDRTTIKNELVHCSSRC